MLNLNDLKKMDKDDLLHMIGLERRREATDWLLPTLGAFSVGMLVGAGIGLLLAPKPGAELRSDLRNRLQQGGSLDMPNGQQRSEEPRQPVARSA
jgi:hypothetical protein